MSYVTLGSRVAVAAADPTGLNTGNWTNAFGVGVLKVTVPYYEIYAITVKDVPSLATVTGYVGVRVRTTALLVGDAEWDPQQPMLMTPTDELYLAWNQPATGTPPTATIWLRYDPAIQPTGALT